MMVNELVGIAEAAQAFSESEGPTAVFLDTNTGDVWARDGHINQMDGALCIMTKGLFSVKSVSEEALSAVCQRNLAVLIPQFEKVGEECYE